MLVAHLDDRQEQLQADLKFLARPEAEEYTLSSSSRRPLLSLFQYHRGCKLV
jgi:hypothetical protein